MLIHEAMSFFAQIKKKGYARNVSEFFMRLALDEALENALRHGNNYDHSKAIVFRMKGDKTKIKVTIQDQGKGFRPDRIANPLHGNNRYAPNGRGLHLLTNIGDVSWNSEGNCVSIELSK
ncbi:MAG: ATP-binding protein [Spirochaetes bacterium]|nr:ATP-binding protein [Spirochaetota bacterium]